MVTIQEGLSLARALACVEKLCSGASGVFDTGHPKARSTKTGRCGLERGIYSLYVFIRSMYSLFLKDYPIFKTLSQPFH